MMEMKRLQNKKGVIFMNENLREQKMVSNAPFFILATLGYALFYVFCLYKNVAGITFPLFTAGTILYFIL